MSRIPGLSNFDSFRNGWSVAVQLLLCAVLSPWVVRNILEYLPSSSIRLVSVHVVHSYSSIDTTTWKKLHFILSTRSKFHMTDSLSMAVHAFASRVLMSVSGDETLLSWLVNLSTCFRVLLFSVEMSPLWLKYIYSVLCTLTWRPMPAATRSRLCCRVLAWAGAFVRSAI